MTDVILSCAVAAPALIYLQTKRGPLAQLLAVLTWFQTGAIFLRVWYAASLENRKHFWALAKAAQSTYHKQ